MEILKNTEERLRRRVRRPTEITVMEHGDRGGRKRLLWKLKTANCEEIRVNNIKVHQKQFVYLWIS
jgi:hypothetical protein